MKRGLFRGVPWPPLLCMTAGGGTLLGVAAAVPSSWLGVRLIGVGFALLAAAAAFVFDEPGAAVVDAAPYSLKVRNLVRASVVAAPLAVSALALALMRLSDASTPFGRLCLQAVGLIVVSVAAAATVRRFRATPGELVGSTIALVVVGLSVADPFARWVPLLPLSADDHWGRTSATWSVAIAAGLLVLLRASRDRLDA
ncbi:MAG: hypothetical protein M3070_19255 [Actinomycetota bacterium]|nr:hypothetical protein [Actinomycetota bacterium]